MIPLDVNLDRYLDFNMPTLDRVEHPRDVSKLTIKAYDAMRDQTIHLTGSLSDVDYQVLPAEPDEREIGKRIDDAAAGRYWAAFTDDQLATLRAALNGLYGEWRNNRIDPLFEGIEAEIKRRKP